MSYEITYRRKLIKTANPDFGLFIEETGENNCWTYNQTSGREVRERNTYVSLINFKNNTKLKMWENFVEKLQEEHQDKDILKGDSTYWLSWRSGAKDVQGTINFFKPKAYKVFDPEIDDFDRFLCCLPTIKWFTNPETIEENEYSYKTISENIFKSFTKRKRVLKKVDPKDRIYNIQINGYNLLKFTRSGYRYSYNKNYTFTEVQMKRLKKKIEEKGYKDVLIEKDNNITEAYKLIDILEEADSNYKEFKFLGKKYEVKWDLDRYLIYDNKGNVEEFKSTDKVIDYFKEFQKI